jgi:hypothetical protein
MMSRELAEGLVDLDGKVADLLATVQHNQALAEGLWLRMDPKQDRFGGVEAPRDRPVLVWAYYDKHPSWGVGVQVQAEGQELVLTMGPHELRVRISDHGTAGGFTGVSITNRAKDDEG